jgi:cobalt-zinc-cadmium efflux system outer membrane protein
MPVIAALLLLTFQQPADSVSLDDALARARIASPRAEIAAAMVAQAKGSFSLSGSLSNPALSFEHDNLAPTQKLVVSQDFDWLLRRGSDRAQGNAALLGARADSTQMMAELARDVRLAFFFALAAQEEHKLSLQQMSAMDTLAMFAERRLAAGDISALERDQVLLEVLRWRQTVSRSREVARAAQVQLGNLVNNAAPVETPARGTLDAGLAAASVLDAQTAADIDNLPLVRSASAAAAAASANHTAVSKSRVPIPGLRVGREWGELDPDQTSTILGFSLSLPLWSQGAPGVAISRANLSRSNSLAEAARRDAASNLAVARTRLDESAARARIARDSIVPMATRLRQSAVRLFEAGQTGALPVFEAFRQEREAIHDALQDVRQFQEARANALALLGRWS